MNPGPEKLTVDVARQLTFKATAPARTTEEILYDKCGRCVRQEAASGSLSAVCTIPRFTFGLPMYSRRIMRDKVAMRFEREGFVVQCHGGDGLVIGWGGEARSKPAATPKANPPPRGKPKAKPAQKRKS